MNRLTITKDSYFTFSAGEPHLKVPQEAIFMASVERSFCLACSDYSMNGLMAVCEYADVLRRNGVGDIHLTYPYLPFSRQDRVIDGLEPFSLKLFAEIVNAQRFASVAILDPHSDVAPALLDNCYVVPQWDIARRVIPQGWFDDPETLFVSPDAGAYKKVAKLISDDSRIVTGVKVRGEGGKILHTDVFSPTDIHGRPCLIIDDICDGGRTFVALAECLLKKGAKSVALYVTHGIFSKGFDELQCLSAIYTTNSFQRRKESIPSFVTVTEVI